MIESLVKAQIQSTRAIKPEQEKGIYWTMVLTNTIALLGPRGASAAIVRASALEPQASL
jgi:hypothetical protein